jgi:hypothetical protein
MVDEHNDDESTAEGGGGSPAESSRASRLRFALAVLATLAVVVYALAVMKARFTPAFAPWVAETDWKQAVWQYYRYYEEGVFPAGHALTDYAFVYHGQPLYLPLMATLSTFFDPRFAANLINIGCFVAALVFIYYAVRARSSHFVGLASVVFLAHDARFFRITAGGYARTFGPTLTLAFLAAWLSGRRRLVLVVLMVQAGIYPSVAVPSCVAFGIYSLIEFWRDRKWRPIAELAGTAVAVIALAMAQNIRAPSWWGSLVWMSEAKQMPAFFPGSRMPLVPLKPIGRTVWHTVRQGWGHNGEIFPELAKWNHAHDYVATLGLVGVALLIALIRRQRFPLHIPWLMLCAFGGYMLARTVAFQMFVPRRMMDHVWPYALAVAIPLAFWFCVQGLAPKSRRWIRELATVLLVIVPLLVFAGHGVAKRAAYRNYAKDAKLYEFVKTLPKQAQFAGNMQPMDEIPLFSQRQPYVNWKLAHPFRKGYWAEIERRVLRMYEAFYATDFDTVLRFADEEKIDYFIVDRKRFKKLEKGDGQLFEPLRSKVRPWFRQGRGNFVLDPAPEEAILFEHRGYDVIDLAKLAEWWHAEEAARAARAAEEAAAPPPDDAVPAAPSEAAPPP